jgi:hypothetical protein
VGDESGLKLSRKSDMLYTLCFATCIGDIGLEAKENPSNTWTLVCAVPKYFTTIFGKMTVLIGTRYNFIRFLHSNISSNIYSHQPATEPAKCFWLPPTKLRPFKQDRTTQSCCIRIKVCFPPLPCVSKWQNYCRILESV